MCKKLKHNALSYVTFRRYKIKNYLSRISNCPSRFSNCPSRDSNPQYYT